MSVQPELSRLIQAALPYAPEAQALAESILNGTNVSRSPAERKALRRLSRIEGSDRNRIEFVATQIVVNAGQAARSQDTGALQCVRNGVTNLIRLTRS